MSFNPAKPANNESPALFPAENRANMARLETLISEDHQFNNPPTTNDGWHKIVHWIQQGTSGIDPLDPATNAPDNSGGPPISWEQLDSYNVPRAWLRAANNGNLQSMCGEIEVRGQTTLSTGLALCVTPPENTIGTFLIYNSDLGIIQFAYYVNEAGAFAINTTVNDTANPKLVAVAASLSGGITGRVIDSAYDGIYTWRLFYRYI